MSKWWAEGGTSFWERPVLQGPDTLFPDVMYVNYHGMGCEAQPWLFQTFVILHFIIGEFWCLSVSFLLSVCMCTYGQLWVSGTNHLGFIFLTYYYYCYCFGTHSLPALVCGMLGLQVCSTTSGGKCTWQLLFQHGREHKIHGIHRDYKVSTHVWLLICILLDKWKLRSQHI